jgi:predicted phosphoribosyltransferase
MSFRDRQDAGRRLAARLRSYKNQHPVILALPRGGVPVAAEVAAELGAPLDLILVRKIGLPWQPELAMGAVVDGGAPLVVRNESVVRLARISHSEFKRVCDEELAEIERRRRLYLGDRKRIDIAGRTAIVVDDGVATGATTRAALRATRMRSPKTLILAVPVGPTQVIAEMREEADEVICLEEHEYFGAIGLYYSDFRQIEDQDVIDLLARFPEDEGKTLKRSTIKAWRSA